MKEDKTIVTKTIDDVVYIIENTTGESAKESAYEKIKKMILNDIELYQ